MIADDSVKAETIEDKEYRPEPKESERDDKTLVDSGSGDKIQLDSGKLAEKRPTVILSSEEIKDKLKSNIEDIGVKIDGRMKLSKKMLIRDLDIQLMESLTKAVITKREKASPYRITKRPIYKNNLSMNMTTQNIKARARKIRDRPSPQSGIFQNSGSYIKPSPIAHKRPLSVEGKKHN